MVRGAADGAVEVAGAAVAGSLAAAPEPEATGTPPWSEVHAVAAAMINTSAPEPSSDLRFLNSVMTNPLPDRSFAVRLWEGGRATFRKVASPSSVYIGRISAPAADAGRKPAR
ncbi:hypothetical protein GCM10027360_67960 [Amycolatopsis echigonensis]